MSRRTAQGISLVLLVVSLAVLFLQVGVTAGDVDATCGSAFDVVTDRTGWQQWWSQDLGDPALAASEPLLRTEACPGAVNSRILIAGALAMAAVAVWAVGEIRWWRSHPTSGASDPRLPAQRIRALGVAVAATGAVLTIGGIVALIALVADPDSTLFLYVPRTVVALIGLIVLIPAVALAAGGRALELTGRQLGADERSDETA